MTLTDRARAYLARLDPAVSGAGGHDATFKAAATLARFGLSEPGALPLMVEFNSRCQPPWSEAELRHKLRDAFRKTKPDPKFTESRGRAELPRDELTPEQKRAQWSAFSTPAADDLRAVSNQRNISLAGLRLAADRGLLFTATHHAHRCWLVADATRTNAQARRMDGQPFLIYGEKKKALTLPGSIASWPVGLPHVATARAVMLCEGGPDLLAAHALIVAHGRTGDTAAIAMLGASLSIPESALVQFDGKVVRIFADVGQSGRKAAARWAAQLQPFAAEVDVFCMEGLNREDGQPVADLNDLLLVDADTFDAHPNLRSLCP